MNPNNRLEPYFRRLDQQNQAFAKSEMEKRTHLAFVLAAVLGFDSIPLATAYSVPPKIPKLTPLDSVPSRLYTTSVDLNFTRPKGESRHETLTLQDLRFLRLPPVAPRQPIFDTSPEPHAWAR